MKIVARYDFNGGKNAVESNYAEAYAEIAAAIKSVDSSQYITKGNNEKTINGKMLFSSSEINAAFKRELVRKGWKKHKVQCDYAHGEYLSGYIAAKETRGQFRDMDFVKPGMKLGVEFQFGKYSFMVYNVCTKMTIFKNLGIIDTGIEIVPVKRFANEMSTGVSYFEQFAWDLEHRGTSNIDIPVLILGIDA